MKWRTIFPACFLLLWTLTVPVSCDDGQSANSEITVKTVSDAIVLSCDDKSEIKDSSSESVKDGKLAYRDENTGEYKCAKDSDDVDSATKIFVKFRTCDNCIELDQNSIIGIVAGNVVATIVIGVAVYLVASLTQSGPVTSHKKSSDRQHLVPNEVSNRAPNDHYQPLKHKGGQKDMYDVLTNRR